MAPRRIVPGFPPVRHDAPADSRPAHAGWLARDTRLEREPAVLSIDQRSTVLWSTARSTPETTDRQRKAHARRRQLDEIFDERDLAHVLQVVRVVTDDPGTVTLPRDLLAP